MTTEIQAELCNKKNNIYYCNYNNNIKFKKKRLPSQGSGHVKGCEKPHEKLFSFCEIDLRNRRVDFVFFRCLGSCYIHIG